MSSVDRDQTFRFRAAQSARVLVHDDTAGEDHLAVVLGNGYRQLPPMQPISTDGMPPAHVPPLIAERVVLKEKVVLAAEEH